jgi:hypothetical protein
MLCRQQRNHIIEGNLKQVVVTIAISGGLHYVNLEQREVTVAIPGYVDFK